jgi:vancomycin resistance protein YoaR
MSNVTVKLLQYEIDFFSVSVSQYVGGSDCNGYTFINYGTSVVKIEQIVLQPNQQFEVTGNVGENTTQRYFVNFGSSSSGNNVVIVKKRYINLQ